MIECPGCGAVIITSGGGYEQCGECNTTWHIPELNQDG